VSWVPVISMHGRALFGLAVIAYGCRLSDGGGGKSSGTQADAATDDGGPWITEGGTVSNDRAGNGKASDGSTCLYPDLYGQEGTTGMAAIWAMPLAQTPAKLQFSTLGGAGVNSLGDLVTVESLGPGGPAFIVEKRNSGGQVTLSQVFGAGATFLYDGSPFTRAEVAGITPDGGILIVGEFTGTVDFGLGPLTSQPPVSAANTICPAEGGVIDSGASSPSAPKAEPDLFVLKIDATGAPVYDLRFGDEHQQVFSSLAIDRDGNAVLGGTMLGTVDFGGGPRASSGWTGFVVKLDANGHHIYSDVFGGGCVGGVSKVVVDGNGNAVVVAYSGNHDIAGTPVEGAAVVELDPSGTVRWVRGDLVPAEPTGALVIVAANRDGSVAVAGTPPSSNLGCGPITSAPLFERSVFIAALTSDGQTRWARTFNASYNWRNPVIDAHGIGIWPDGSIVLGGEIQGPFDFGGGPLGGTDWNWYLAKFDASGHHIWSTASVDWSMHFANILATSDGGFYALGEDNGDLNLGSGSFTVNGGFVGKFGP
jgi:hypothetical protein